MPEKYLELKFTRQGEGRQIELCPQGERYEELARGLIAQQGREG